MPATVAPAPELESYLNVDGDLQSSLRRVAQVPAVAALLCRVGPAPVVAAYDVGPLQGFLRRVAPAPAVSDQAVVDWVAVAA